MKKILSFFLTIIMIFTCGALLSSCKEQSPQLETTSSVQNLVILIGDGMGENHIKNAKMKYGIESLEFENDFKCKVNTDSKTLIGPTDSAAAATAMATGKSVNNKVVSKDGNKNIETILEYASKNGMKTGVVTTDTLSGATPACFSSHAKERGDSLDILLGQLESNVDLFIGQTNSEYISHASDFRNKGYTVVENFTDLKETKNDEKVVALLDNIKSIYNEELNNQTDFSEIVNFATSHLENENGFVLMVECAHIDKFSHKKNLLPALAEVHTLFDVANTLYAYDKAHNNNTAIIITADHETGGLALARDKKYLESSTGNSLYKRSGHTNTNVNLYVHNVKFKDQATKVKNTFVFTISKFVIDNRKTA